MAYDFPADLINQVQISTRNEAGLSSYDPIDPTFPPLPPLAASIANFDPSSENLRCMYCEGKFMNGLNSLICGYCGKYQQGEVPLKPISFKSSYGCHFLLKSLGLKGSEMIFIPTKGIESKRGPSTSKKRIPVSNLLDLQIKWSDKSSLKLDANATNNIVEHNIFYLNDLIPAPENDAVLNSNEKHPEISIRIESTESKSVPSEDNLTLCHNVTVCDTTDRSSNNTNSNALNDCNEDFQSVSSENQHIYSKSFDSFKYSTLDVDLSGDTNTAFGEGKQHLDSNVTGNADWFQDSQQQMITDEVDDDDLFNEWNANFTSSTGAQDPSRNEMTSFNESKSEKNRFDSTNNSKDIDFGSFSPFF